MNYWEKFGKPWPKHCPQAIFVEGATWALTGGFVFPYDTTEARQEAIRRYGEVPPPHHGYGCPLDGEEMTEPCPTCKAFDKEHQP